MKKLDTVLKEYTSRLSVDNLKYLTERLEDRLSSDTADVLNEMSLCQDLDNWLLSAKSYTEFYDMLDNIQEYCQRELVKRAPELQQV